MVPMMLLAITALYTLRPPLALLISSAWCRILNRPILAAADSLSPVSLQQAFELLVFRDPAGKAPPQLLAATNPLGVLKIDGDTASPALPRERGLVNPARSLMQSRKSPNRVFVGRFGSLSSMRWEDGRWIDEGGLRTDTATDWFAEEPDGTLWAGTYAGAVLRLTVPVTGMLDAK